MSGVVPQGLPLPLVFCHCFLFETGSLARTWSFLSKLGCLYLGLHHLASSLLEVFQKSVTDFYFNSSLVEDNS